MVTGPAGVADPTRRNLLSCFGAGLGAGAVVVVAGCGGSAHEKGIRSAPPSAQSADIALLNRALDLEHETVAAYTAGIPLLTGRAKKATQQFLDQELSHAGELYGLIKQAKGTPVKPRPDYELGHPRSSDEVLNLVHGLERRQIALYLGMITRLSPGSVRAAITAILANDAQHVAIVRSAIGLPPLRGPLVTGTE